MGHFMYAQTQLGYVKTKGRMVNGKLVPGHGLKGATVSIKGRTTVLVKTDDGAFSFPIPEAQFRLDSVRKKGYQLVDMNALGKTFKHSSNPLYIVMETPEQQQQDQLTAERKIRRNLQRQLQEKEDEIEGLKAQQKITDEEYRKALQKLYQEQEDNEQLIKEMAKRYSELDYDQLDEFYRQVSYCIENGDLVKADSLLSSRGDITAQVADILMRGQALQKEKEQLQKAEAVQQADIEEAARRCYSYYETFVTQHLNDTAAYFLELRANLDTTNAEWQTDAGSFLSQQNQKLKAERYYYRALSLYRHLANNQPESYNIQMISTMGALASLYAHNQRYVQSETLLNEALDLCNQMLEADPDASTLFLLRIDLQSTLMTVYLYTDRVEEGKDLVINHIVPSFIQMPQRDLNAFVNNIESLCSSIFTDLYYVSHFYVRIKDYEVGEDILNRTMDINRQIANIKHCYEDFPALKPIIELNRAGFDNLLYEIYTATNRLDEAETVMTDAISLYRPYAKDNPQAYGPHFAATLLRLGMLYVEEGKHEKAVYPTAEALEFIRPILSYSPEMPEYYYLALSLLSALYGDFNQRHEAYITGLELLPLMKQRWHNNPSFGAEYASTLGNQSFFAIFGRTFTEAEQLATQALEVDPTQLYIETNHAAALLLQGKYAEAEAIYSRIKDSLKDNCLQDLNDFETAGVIPKERKADVERIRKMLTEE